jgi:hypothetical protein
MIYAVTCIVLFCSISYSIPFFLIILSLPLIFSHSHSFSNCLSLNPLLWIFLSPLLDAITDHFIVSSLPIPSLTYPYFPFPSLFIFALPSPPLSTILSIPTNLLPLLSTLSGV